MTPPPSLRASLSFACAVQLLSLVEVLGSCQLFGFDLEAHNARTYHGLTCLLQISTEHKVVCSSFVCRDMYVL